MDVLAVALLAIHHGLVALRVSPQVFWRFGSVAGASPGTSDASGVTLYWLPGGAAGAAPTASRATTSVAASAAGTRRCMSPPSVVRSAGPTLTPGTRFGPFSQFPPDTTQWRSSIT